ncbi:MAG: acetyl-CoA acetyltransferase, partial [Hyphomicrobiales bacterium]
MGTGLRDRVAIAGMGCTRFGERWECDAEDLMLEAYLEALNDAGIEPTRIDAAWLGVFQEEMSLGKSAIPLSVTLRLRHIPVTRVENMCATGIEALRGAVYAVAAGACDVALALGVEKLKDSGYGGLPARTMGMAVDPWLPDVS